MDDQIESMKRVKVVLDEEDAEKLEQLQVRLGRSKAVIMRRALRNLYNLIYGELELWQTRHKQNLESGRGQELLRWLKSYLRAKAR